jgi:Protein of unknown function (DUF3800)
LPTHRHLKVSSGTSRFTTVSVRITIDTSGSFDVAGTPPRKPAVAAALVVSERHAAEVKSELRRFATEFGVDELHAVDLSSDQLLTLAGWAGRDSRLVWTAALTDAVLFPADRLDDWRERQAVKLEEAVARTSQERVAEVLAGKPIDWHLRRLRPGTKTSLPIAHFVEHLYVIPRLVGDAVQAAIDVHDGPQWGDEFDALAIAIDDSSAPDAKAQLKDLLKPTLASRDLALVPPPRSGLDHPLFAKHIDERGRRGSLLSLVGDRIRYVDSASSPLCQLADLFAWVVRRRAADRADELAARLYRLVRPRQHGIEGARGVRIMSMRSVPDHVGSYDHVAAWVRERT